MQILNLAFDRYSGALAIGLALFPPGLILVWMVLEKAIRLFTGSAVRAKRQVPVPWSPSGHRFLLRAARLPFQASRMPRARCAGR